MQVNVECIFSFFVRQVQLTANPSALHSIKLRLAYHHQLNAEQLTRASRLLAFLRASEGWVFLMQSSVSGGGFSWFVRRSFAGPGGRVELGGVSELER